MSQPRRPALGRGLSALIPSADAPTGPSTLPISQVHPSATQPRTAFDDQRIAELSASIEANGILQPILVRRVSRERYEIIAGERRFRAARRAGLAEVPVTIRDASDSEAYELALVENVQREDLNPVEEALAYRHLADLRGMTQEEVAQRVGKDRVTVANSLRLLKLPPPILDRLAAAEITAGHARAILTCPDPEGQLELAQQAVDGGWSVRETERQARARKQPAPPPPADETPSVDEAPSPATRAVEEQLRALLGAPVRLVHRGGQGRIEIRFHSLDELERLIDLISGVDGR
ncbi:MAG: ParB/RepB/Spo0J family partition protein [Myxococcales bacterium]|nr:ParB/RepB/Spo0J family partition protein [Myxococcales bacterium]